MHNWSHYLHREAVEAGIQILDTYDLPIHESVRRLTHFLLSDSDCGSWAALQVASPSAIRPLHWFRPLMSGKQISQPHQMASRQNDLRVKVSLFDAPHELPADSTRREDEEQLRG